MCAMDTNPLESYFKKYPDKRPKVTYRCSGLWRGYVATFEIQDNHLLLKDIALMLSGLAKDEKGNNHLRWKSIMNEVFPNHNVVRYDWTGVLVLPSGKLIRYVHMGYMSTYEYYTLLVIKNGCLIDEKQIGNEDYKDFGDALVGVLLQRLKTE